jgi:hypothetical protein
MNDLSLTNHVMRHPETISTEMDGETVMMSVENGYYYGLNSVGSRVWMLMVQRMTIAEICRVIEAEYDIDAVECERAIMSFISQLSQNGLVSIS